MKKKNKIIVPLGIMAVSLTAGVVYFLNQNNLEADFKNKFTSNEETQVFSLNLNEKKEETEETEETTHPYFESPMLKERANKKEEVEETREEKIDKMIKENASSFEKEHNISLVENKTSGELEFVSNEKKQQVEETLSAHTTPQNEIEQALIEQQAQQNKPAQQPLCDRNGLPYLQPGQSYTFDPVTGFPQQAPPNGGDSGQIYNPANGLKYIYLNSHGHQEWGVSTIDEQIARADRIMAGIEREDGTKLKDENGNFIGYRMTDEDIESLAKSIARSFQ